MTLNWIWPATLSTLSQMIKLHGSTKGSFWESVCSFFEDFFCVILGNAYFLDTPPIRLIRCYCLPIPNGRLVVLAFNKEVKPLKIPVVSSQGKQSLLELHDIKERHNLYLFEIHGLLNGPVKVELEDNAFEDSLRKKPYSAAIEFECVSNQVAFVNLGSAQTQNTNDSVTHCLPKSYWEKELESVQELLDLEPGCKCMILFVSLE